MELTSNIGYLLQHLSTAIARQNDQVLQEQLGIGFSQFKILMVLQWNPRIQQKQIAEALGQTEASISRQIRLMQRERLLRRQKSPVNRREHLTTATDKGIRLTQEARRILNDYHAPMFNQLNEKQRQQLLNTLTILHEYTCAPGKPGACHQFDLFKLKNI